MNITFFTLIESGLESICLDNANKAVCLALESAAIEKMEKN